MIQIKRDFFKKYIDLGSLEESEPLNYMCFISSGKDDGFNDYCTRGLPSNRYIRHINTEEFVNNMKNSWNSNGIKYNAFGHGNCGLFETGAGSSSYNYHQIIDSNTQWVWEPLLTEFKDKLEHPLWLYSCYTGAEESGADLLYEMAKCLGVAVTAQTGLTTCDSNGRISFQDGSVMQWGKPNRRYPALSKPPLPQPIINDAKIYPVISNRVLELSNLNVISMIIRTGKKEKKISKSKRSYFASMILNNTPYDTMGEIAGIETTSIDIELLIDNEVILYKIAVLNDDISVVKNENIFYILPKEFKSIIN